MIAHTVKMTKWEPIQGLSDNSVIDNKDGFQVTLIDLPKEEHKVIIHFRCGVRSYRATDEAFSWIDLYKDASLKHFPWCFFKITNSDYLHWASLRSGGVSDYINTIHFAIYTTELTLEFLDGGEPRVTMMQNIKE